MSANTVPLLIAACHRVLKLRMASPSLYTAVKGWLQTTFAPMQVLDFDQIEPQLEQGTASFLVVEELFASESSMSIGDRAAACLREEASILVHVFVPAPESSSAARTLADNVRQRNAYRTINGVRITSASPPDLEVLNDGLWSVAVIDAEAQFDRHVALP